MNIISGITIPSLDTKRYSGKWYEILKLPFKWEKGCGPVTAEYSSISDVRISINNTCYIDENKISEIINSSNNILDDKLIPENIKQIIQSKNKEGSFSRKGFGDVIDLDEPGKLRVYFDDGLPSDKIERQKTNYWIFFLNYDTYSVVGNPNGDQVWLLSRSDRIPKNHVDYFIDYIGKLGYNKNNLLIQPNIKTY